MDLPVDYTDIRDVAEPQRDGSVVRMKRATFYLGKHGPFVERLPNDDQFDTELARRVETLRRKLQSLPT